MNFARKIFLSYEFLLKNAPKFPPKFSSLYSGTDMTGRPGYRTMEMIGGSSAPYLARTPCVPLFCISFNRVGNKERFRLLGAGGGSFFHCTVERSPAVIFGVDLFCGSEKIPQNSRQISHQISQISKSY